MKRTLKKLLDIPTSYTIGIGILTVILSISIFNGTLSTLSAILIVGIAALITLQIHLGSIVIKSVTSSLAIMYMISIYTNVVMIAHGRIIEPFLLTIASITVFLAVTYSSKNYTHGMRSRPLWSAVVVIVLVSVKMSFIINGYSFLMTEIIGLNMMAAIISLWVLWIRNSKKTKIIEPTIKKTETLDGFKFIYIENELNVKDGIWMSSSVAGKNARPWIHNEVLKSKDEGLSLVLISTLNTNKIYDIGEITLHKSKSIKYLYMEAKENHYFYDTMDNFIEELQRGKSSN